MNNLGEQTLTRAGAFKLLGEHWAKCLMTFLSLVLVFVHLLISPLQMCHLKTSDIEKVCSLSTWRFPG